MISSQQINEAMNIIFDIIHSIDIILIEITLSCTLVLLTAGIEIYNCG